MSGRYHVLFLWSAMLVGFGLSSVFLPLVLGLSTDHVEAIKASMQTHPLPWMWMNNGVQFFAFFLPAALMYTVARKKDSLPCFPMKTSFALALLAVPAFGFMDVLGELNHVIISWMPGLYEEVLESENQMDAMTELMLSSYQYHLPVVILTIALVPAMFEEFFFRGVLQRLFMKTNGAHTAIWMSAAAFSLIHFQFLGFIPRLVMGAMLGYITWLTGNWWYSAGVHFFNNLAGILLFVQFGSLELQGDRLEWAIIYQLMGAIILCLWAFLMRKNYFRYFPSEAAK